MRAERIPVNQRLLGFRAALCVLCPDPAVVCVCVCVVQMALLTSNGSNRHKREGESQSEGREQKLNVRADHKKGGEIAHTKRVSSCNLPKFEQS